MAMRSLILAALAGLWLSAPGANAQSAADPAELAAIRSELAQLQGQMEALRFELLQTGTAQAPATAATGPATLRLDRLEEALRQVTGRVEQMAFRIDQIVVDGTRRIGDLEFRLVELEGGDVTTLPEPAPLGGATADTVVATAKADVTQSPQIELAVSEQSDFDAAMAALTQGDQFTAINLFGKFLADYPGGPLSAEAMFHLGEAQTGLGRSKEAARSYLDSFTVQPSGPYAARALTKVGLALGELGQVGEACRTLAEVLVRYPGDDALPMAQTGMAGFGCS